MELRDHFLRRLRQIDPGSIERPQIVIDRDRAPHEQHLEPHGTGQRAVRGGLIGRERHGLSQELDGFVVLMLVDQLRRSSAQRISRLWLRVGRSGPRPEKQHRHARAQ